MKPDDIDSVSTPLQRLCRTVRAGAVVGGLFTLLGPPWFWSRADWVAAVGGGMAGLGCQPFDTSAPARAWGLVASLPPMAAGLMLFVALWRLFGEYGQGRALRLRAQQLLQSVAWALLALAVLQPLSRAALSVALTLERGPGQRQLVLQLSGDDYLFVLIALALLAVAVVMRQAVQAAEENRGFV